MNQCEYFQNECSNIPPVFGSECDTDSHECVLAIHWDTLEMA